MPGEIKHYGVKGMKWGVRRQTRSVAEEAARANAFKQQARKQGVSSLSNAQLKELNTRLELESKFNQWSAKNPTLSQRAKKFVAEKLLEFGTDAVKQGMADGGVTKVVKQAMGQSGSRPRQRATPRESPKQRPVPTPGSAVRTTTPVYNVTTLPRR